MDNIFDGVNDGVNDGGGNPTFNSKRTVSKEEQARIKSESWYNFIGILIIFACISITCLLNC